MQKLAQLTTYNRTCGIIQDTGSSNQRVSLEGTQADEPELTRMTSLTWQYMSSGVSPMTIATTHQQSESRTNLVQYDPVYACKKKFTQEFQKVKFAHK